jgi:murein DD-endopeptidase
VPAALESSPLADYEQITALLRDRPRHRGMDFKAPTGTRVVAPFRATITRVNWKPANGTCIELEFADRVTAKFLHLSRIAPGMTPGRTVEAGVMIAESGNTGRSTAPHLHYQLERPGGQVVDPLVYHRTRNRHLPEGTLPAFQVARERWQKVLGPRA